MIIKSLELADFRNYDSLHIEFSEGTNILYGDNAQGKTNILEAIYLSAITKSHKGSKDRDIVNFDKEEAHIRTYLEKDGIETRVDMHLRKNKSKGIAIDGQKIKKAAELIGLLNVVFLFHIVKPFAPVTVFHVFQLYFEDTVGKVFFGMLGHVYCQ